MRRDISRRIKRLEQTAGIGVAPLPIVFMSFGIGNHAEYDGRKWHRRTDEGEAQFHVRIAADLASVDPRLGIAVWLYQ
jgi:hypothetical protein